jgi:hypothetical protein
MRPYFGYLGICCWLVSHVVGPGVALAAKGHPPFSTADANWQTDFSRHTVPLHEIRSGGPPRDGIPPIDRPRFVDVATADTWLQDREPAVVVERQGVAKAYPLQILIWHEIVNDTLVLQRDFTPVSSAVAHVVSDGTGTQHNSVVVGRSQLPRPSRYRIRAGVRPPSGTDGPAGRSSHWRFF